MNKIYEIGDLMIDFRKFYQIWITKEEYGDKIGWSSYWICGEHSCTCGELEEMKKEEPNLKYRLVPWYKRVFTLSHKDRYLYLIIGFIVGYLTKTL